MRNAKKLVVALSFAVMTATGGRALALPTGVYITEHAADPQSKTFEKDLKKNAKTVLKQDGTVWHVNFVAYLNKAAGTNELNIVFYDLTKKGESPNAYPISTQPNAKIILSSLELSPEQNFKVGGKYEVRITRLEGGKEIVFAKGKLELK